MASFDAEAAWAACCCAAARAALERTLRRERRMTGFFDCTADASSLAFTRPRARVKAPNSHASIPVWFLDPPGRGLRRGRRPHLREDLPFRPGRRTGGYRPAGGPASPPRFPAAHRGPPGGKTRLAVAAGIRHPRRRPDALDCGRGRGATGNSRGWSVGRRRVSPLGEGAFHSPGNPAPWKYSPARRARNARPGRGAGP